MHLQIGVRQVIAGWDIGILGDEQNGIPPMKVLNRKLPKHQHDCRHARMQCCVPCNTITGVASSATRASDGASPALKLLLCISHVAHVRQCDIQALGAWVCSQEGGKRTLRIPAALG